MNVRFGYKRYLIYTKIVCPFAYVLIYVNGIENIESWIWKQNRSFCSVLFSKTLAQTNKKKILTTGE